MTVDLSQVVYSDQVKKVAFTNQDGSTSTCRDLYLQMFSVIHEDDSKATIAKKEELLRVYRKVLNSESEFTTDEVVVLKDRAAKIFPSIVIYSQISENLGH
jgi:hypothetical protein